MRRPQLLRISKSSAFNPEIQNRMWKFNLVALKDVKFSNSARLPDVDYTHMRRWAWWQQHSLQTGFKNSNVARGRGIGSSSPYELHCMAEGLGTNIRIFLLYNKKLWGNLEIPRYLERNPFLEWWCCSFSANHAIFSQYFNLIYSISFNLSQSTRSVFSGPVVVIWTWTMCAFPGHGYAHSHLWIRMSHLQSRSLLGRDGSDAKVNRMEWLKASSRCFLVLISH